MVRSQIALESRKGLDSPCCIALVCMALVCMALVCMALVCMALVCSCCPAACTRVLLLPCCPAACRMSPVALPYLNCNRPCSSYETEPPVLALTCGPVLPSHAPFPHPSGAQLRDRLASGMPPKWKGLDLHCCIAALLHLIRVSLDFELGFFNQMVTTGTEMGVSVSVRDRVRFALLPVRPVHT